MRVRHESVRYIGVRHESVRYGERSSYVCKSGRTPMIEKKRGFVRCQWVRPGHAMLRTNRAALLHLLASLL